MHDFEKKSILEKIFDFFFVLYVIFIFCFNDNADYNILIYLSLAGCIGMTLFTFVLNMKELHFPKILWLLLIYGAYCYASSFWAWYPSLSMMRFPTIMQLIIITIMFVGYFVYRKNVELIIKSLMLAGIISSIYVIISYGGLSAFYAAASREGQRLGEAVGQVNSLGLYASYSLIVLFYYAFYRKKLLFYPVMIIPFLVAMGSGSRKALLSIMIGIGVLLILSQSSQKKNIPKMIGKFILIITCCAVVIYFVMKLPIMSTVAERMEGLLQTISGEEGDSSSMIRQKMIEGGIKQFRRTPIFGIGLNNAQIVNGIYTGKYVYLHNDYIEQLVNLGVIGAFMYYGVIAYALIGHIKLLRTQNGVVYVSLSLMLMFLVNLVGSVSYYGKLTYVFITLWISVPYIMKKRVSQC